jgi:PAS domain S-box-containing protein
MVVEDEPAYRAFLVEILSTAQYQVLAVDSGEAAVAAPPAYDAAILDLMLPRMSGLDVVRELRRQRPEIPLLLLTAHGTPEVAAAARQAGATACWIKPMSAARIVRALNEYLGRTKPAASPLNLLTPTELLALATALFETAPDAIIVANESGWIVVANGAAERLLGYTRVELAALAVEVLVPERFRARHLEKLSQYQEAPVFRPMGALGPLVARTKTGQEVPIHIALAPMVVPHGTFVIATIRQREGE